MLTYSRIRFQSCWEDPNRRIRSPLHWRDDLERAMKKVCCVVPRTLCPDCIVLGGCTHSRLFYPSLTHPSPPRTRGEVPFAFSPLFPEAQDQEEGGFCLELTLLAPFVERIPYWMVAVMRMGRDRRHPYEVQCVEERADGAWRAVYDGKSEALDHEVRPRGAERISAGSRVVLRWIRPGRIMSKGRPVAGLGFQELVRALLRRAEALSSWYGDGALPWDARDMIARAQEVSLVSEDLRWVERHFRSFRQGQSVALGGLMGSMTLEGDLTPFGELLALGRDLGVGKGTALGLGRYVEDRSPGQLGELHDFTLGEQGS